MKHTLRVAAVTIAVVAPDISAVWTSDAAIGIPLKKGIVRPRKAITQDNVNAPRPAAGTPGCE